MMLYNYYFYGEYKKPVFENIFIVVFLATDNISDLGNPNKCHSGNDLFMKLVLVTSKL